MNRNAEVFDQRFREAGELDYGSVEGTPGRRDRQIIRALTEFGIPGRRCLDIGPGTGRWLHFLKEHGAAELAAVDLSREALVRAARLGAVCQEVDLENQSLGWDTDHVDITTAFMVLEHLKSPDNLIREVARVTRPDGLILMSIPNIASFASRLRLMCGRLPQAVSSDETHVRFYTHRELKKLFRDHGLRASIIPTSFSLNPFNTKSFRLPTWGRLSSLDDHILFRVSA